MKNQIITVALTGVTGAMGGEALKSLTELPDVHINCIVYEAEKKIPSFVRKTMKKHADRITAFKGDIARYEDCERLLEGADYLIHCASIIPPKSDHDPQRTYLSNYIGTKNLVDAVIAGGNKVAFVHIATVAMYGHRAYPHVWARVGDPIISSDYDCYSLYKLKAERYVLESGLNKYVSLRQTAVLHKYMFANNLKDGLMFHTVWNTPLEWVSDVDSGILCKNLIKNDAEGKLDGFWNDIYNIAGGEDCRVTGFESIDGCFRYLVGTGAKKFFKPNWNVTRNFHGVWYYDGDELENFVHYQNENFGEFWTRVHKKHRLFKLGKYVPSPLISKLAIKRLFKDTNAPAYWLKHGKEGRIKAYFGSRENFEAIGTDWDKFPLLNEGRLPDGTQIDYKAFKKRDNAKPYLLNHGYDESKPLESLTKADLDEAAAFRGGKCLENGYKAGDIHKKIEWQCRDGHKFLSSVQTVLRGGYWCPQCCEPKPWRYGSLAKDIPFYAQVYYDSHGKDEENDVYPLDEHEDDFLIVK